MSVKKEASGRRSIQVEDEVPGSTQSAAARRSAEAELRALIDKFAPAHLRLIGAMRRSLRKRLPTAHEGSLGSDFCGRGCATTTRRCARPPGADSS